MTWRYYRAFTPLSIVRGDDWKSWVWKRTLRGKKDQWYFKDGWSLSRPGNDYSALYYIPSKYVPDDVKLAGVGWRWRLERRKARQNG